MPSKNKIVVAYIPSWHMGYEAFLKKRPHDLYLIGSTHLAAIPRLDRDIRAVRAEDMAKIITSLKLVPSVKVLDEKNISDLAGRSIIMPDEELCRQFAETNLSGEAVEFIPVFLRWDRKVSITEEAIPSSRIISSSPADQKYMAIAAQEAELSPDWWRQVGALAVTNRGETLQAHNSPMPSHDYTLNTFGDPRSNFDAGEFIDISKCIHAEAKLIAEAARNGTSLDGAILYVTTYPCPPCAKSVATAGFKKVYYRDGYSLLDAEDILNACGIDIVLVKKFSQLA